MNEPVRNPGGIRYRERHAICHLAFSFKIMAWVIPVGILWTLRDWSGSFSFEGLLWIAAGFLVWSFLMLPIATIRVQGGEILVNETLGRRLRIQVPDVESIRWVPGGGLMNDRIDRSSMMLVQRDAAKRVIGAGNRPFLELTTRNQGVVVIAPRFHDFFAGALKEIGLTPTP